jgi:MFS transporter, SP family, arabinose:H+ symporter
MKNTQLLIWAITVALGGFLFGLDTAVISGAEQTIQKLWNLSDGMHGFAIAIALYGTVFGAFFADYPCEKLGRKKTLFYIGVLYIVSSIGAALAPEVYSFMLARFVGGLAVGASSVAAPLYISEVAPAKSRGQLTALFQFNIVFGILVAFLTNYLLVGFGEGNDWRWMLGVVAIPSFIYTFLIRSVPESPRWLMVHQNDEKTARQILGVTDPGNVDNIIKSIRSTENAAGKQEKEPLFQSKYTRPILLAFLIAFFNQLSGINAVIYFAPRIFEMTGLGKDSALLSTAGIGLVNLIFTMAGLAMIDRYGRRTLLFIGSIGYIVSLALIAWAFKTQSYSGVPIYIFAFIASHAIGQGAVIWVFISEIFPNSVRAAGQAFGCFTHWIFAAIIANIFPTLATKFGGYPVFAFFAGMMVLQLLWTWWMMPETKGSSLEDLETRIIGH